MKGAIFHNRYEILDVLGAGGTAIVYKARDTELNRPVTLKILREQYANDDQFVRRFKHEAQAVACLSHPNIVSIYDVAFDRDSHYLVMEYVEGCTLKQYLEQKGRLSINETLYIMHQLLDGLDHAHKHNVIHRDIKPHNILLDAHMNVKVTDFGIAIAVSDITQTYSKDIMGSVHYMSPEQVKGVAVTEASDIYSAGVVMYEMLTGVLPFSGDNAIGVAMQHVQNEVIPPHKINPEIPVELSSVVMKALRKDPSMRYTDAKEMQAALVNPTLSMDGMAGYGGSQDTRKINNVMTDGTDMQPEQPQKKRGLSSLIFDEVEVDENGNEIGDSSQNQHRRQQPKPVKKQSSNKKTVLLVILACLIVGIGVFAVSSLLGGGKTVEVPDVVGRNVDEAIEMLTAKDLDYTLEYKTADELDDGKDYDEGEVVEQSVEAGTEVKTGKSIKLTVCSGEGPVEVPNVVGKNVDAAKAMLEEMGLNVIIEEEENDSYAPDTVFDQSLKEGSEAEAGDKITLKVSKELEVTVPNLVGLSLDDAKASLAKNKLAVGSISKENSDSYGPDQVISQNVSKNSKVAQGTPIDLVVSIGPAVKNTTVSLKYTIPADDNTHSVQVVVRDDNGERTVSSGSNYHGGDTISQKVTITGSGTAEIIVDGSVVYSKEV